MVVSNHENLVVYVKLLNEFKPELHFLENINVQNGKTETITTAVNLLMERRNLHKMAGFGSDGASVMTGKNNEVSKRMKDNSLFLGSIHWMAHRLALCTSQAANGIPSLVKFKEILTALYRHFDQSALQSQSLAEFQKIFEHPELKLKEVFDTLYQVVFILRYSGDTTAPGSLLWPTWNLNPIVMISLCIQ